jgi:hypothetical protein
MIRIRVFLVGTLLNARGGVVKDDAVGILRIELGGKLLLEGLLETETDLVAHAERIEHFGNTAKQSGIFIAGVGEILVHLPTEILLELGEFRNLGAGLANVFNVRNNGTAALIVRAARIVKGENFGVRRSRRFLLWGDLLGVLRHVRTHRCAELSIESDCREWEALGQAGTEVLEDTRRHCVGSWNAKKQKSKDDSEKVLNSWKHSSLLDISIEIIIQTPR